MKSIKTKITASICSLCLLVLMCTLIASYIISRNALINQYSSKLTVSSQKYSENINLWLDGQTKILNEIAANIKENKNIDNNTQILNYLKERLKSKSDISDIYIGLPNGRLIDGSGWPTPDGYDSTKRDWYKKPIEKNSTVYITYCDMVTKKMLVSIAMPLTKNGQVIGVLCEDLKMDYIINKIEEFKPEVDSYGYLIDDNNNILIHPNKAFKSDTNKFKNLNTVMGGKYKQISNSNGKSINLKDYDGIDKYFVASKIKISNWTIGFAVPQSKFTKDLNSLVISGIVIFLLFIFISIILSLYLGKIISEPIITATQALEEIKGLNFAYDILKLDRVIKNKDESSHIAKAVKSLWFVLHNLVKALKKSSDNISYSVENITKELIQTNKSIEAVSNTINDMANGSVIQSSESEKGLQKLNELSSHISNVVKDANKVKYNSNITKNATSKGVQSIKLLNEKLQDNNNASLKVSQSINSLSEKSKTIDVIVTTIQSVAKQTQLLALNATIESARAGEAGKGFAVVANEIRKLSQETSEATSKILKVVKEIQSEINIGKTNADNAEKTNIEANESMKNCNISFEMIEKSIDMMISIIGNLIKKINDVNVEKDKVINLINNIAKISQESAAESEEISATVEDQNNSITNIGNSMKELKNITYDLNEIINKFKI